MRYARQDEAALPIVLLLEDKAYYSMTLPRGTRIPNEFANLFHTLCPKTKTTVRLI